MLNSLYLVRMSTFQSLKLLSKSFDFATALTDI